MKKVFILLVVIILIALALPVVNLMVGTPSNSLTDLRTEDPYLAKAAAVLGQKCVNCHTAQYKLPFYAALPVAKQMIEKDIQEGTRYLDFQEALAQKAQQPVDEVVLAKTEYAVHHGTMPPSRYVLLHWDGGLNEEEEEDILTWVRQTRMAHHAAPELPPEIRQEVIRPLPKAHNEDPGKVALGDKIFHDPRLSGDDTISCATCHALDKGGTDQLRFSKGINSAMGDINAPTVFNAGFQIKQFWDGRAADLEEQADGPVNNPIEMGADWAAVIAKLEKDEAFVKEFEAVYPDGMKRDHFLDAIAAFERSLITPDSPFDKHLAGEEGALTSEEKEGYALFKDLGCATCHVGPILGGQSFETMGRKEDYFADRGNVHKPDFGRFNVTEKEEDRFKLKVPTLRNIALTGPYFHDGSTDDLNEAVRVMAEYQLGKDPSKQELDRISAFLESLTGEYRGKRL